MILNIELKNFKCHEYLGVEFGRGLQVIRGKVEAGKSSLLQAILYCFYGARALPLPLAETVTWGKNENTLCVKMEFSHAGQAYEIRRSKSGAEILGEGVRVSGQAECTRFIEGLFGVSADLAVRLQIARQKDLEGILEEKAGGTTQIIQRLADFDLLDSLVQKIQDQVPSGSTKILEGLIEEDARTQAPEPPQVESLEIEVAHLIADAQKVDAKADQQRVILNSLNTNAARHAIGKLETLKEKRSNLAQMISDTELELAAAKSVEIKPSKIPEYQTKAAQQLLERRASIAYTYYQSLRRETAVWEGNLADLEGFIRTNEIDQAKYLRNMQEIERNIGKLQGLLITDTECQLCGKDLREVPEVQSRNTEVNAELIKQKEFLISLEQKFKEAKAAVTDGSHVLRTNERYNDKLFTPYAEFLEIDKEAIDTVPARYKWIGPQIEGKALDMNNYESLVRQEQDRLNKQERVQQVLSQAEGRLAALKNEHTLIDFQVKDLEITNPQATLDRAEAVMLTLNEELEHAESLRNQAEKHIRIRENLLMEHKLAITNFETVKKRLVNLREKLVLMQLHNQVISKIREAKPEIARRLWMDVLHAVSHYFSTIRGTPSTVTRTVDGFEVDGRPVGALSGSTFDSLALAVRIALIKTFLPSIGIIALDEPAAACNDEREAAMLGVLSTCDFDQVLMVTHSDLADPFADKIVEI